MIVNGIGYTSVKFVAGMQNKGASLHNGTRNTRKLSFANVVVRITLPLWFSITAIHSTKTFQSRKRFMMVGV